MGANKKYFGTDGVRGRSNTPPMTPTIVMQLGMAAGVYFKQQSPRRHNVVIGKDTRLSGYMFETALVAGFTAVGMDVFQFGPMPTPAVAQLTRSLRADVGVMITASHNPFYDNGIKFFGPDGFKLSDDAEAIIESLMQSPDELELAEAANLGRATRIDDAQARYVEIAKATFPRELTLSGFRIVVDCANGASYKVAPTTLWELGAEVIDINTEPDGFNINDECGATDPSELASKVLETRADIGIAFDGDADRLIIVDEKGRIIDGDQLLGCLATNWVKLDRLKANSIVATVMSNLQLENYLNDIGIVLERSPVGDRHVVELMRRVGANLGGEQSGHIVLSDFATTGDALIAALQLLAIIKVEDRPVSEVCRVFEPLPQKTTSITVSDATAILKADAVVSAIANAKVALGAGGRLLVRASGTEPVIRIMAEGDPVLIDKAHQMVVQAIEDVQKQKMIN
ncbi:phosphoglucosamine mutase [Hyphobacterium sp. HN65]|uniref:Phosphoglucosamine mutase n=1 Tax=Hyphobacterium lacteum TaxID=3116575 RepID=A0ABU7LPS3_9PROT|nr:phosphoglucosamine mutase [Hyphobacterium sp. HN65]MEE2525883.1 phosphoglucosamine mutase [Hyphobacterium sp. HN65]